MPEEHEGGGPRAGGKLKEFAKRPIVWIGIGAVALFFVVRARMSASGSPPAASASPSFGGGGGGFSGGGGPSDTGIGGGIRAQLDQLDLQQAQQELKNSQALFDFNLQQKQGQASMLGPLQQAWADTQAALQKGMLSQVQHTKAQCAHGDAKIDPETGQIYCRTPEGGGNKPFKTIGDALQKTLGGITESFPAMGQAWLGQQWGLYGQATGAGQTQRQGGRSRGSARTQQGMTGSGTGISMGQFPMPEIPKFPGLP